LPGRLLIGGVLAVVLTGIAGAEEDGVQPAPAGPETVAEAAAEPIAQERQAAGPAAGLDEIGLLADGGAPGLALKLLDAYQAAQSLPQAWLQAERLRLDILEAAGDWRSLAQRVDALPEDAPEEFVLEARTGLAASLIGAGRAVEARGLLRELLWLHTVELDRPLVSRWRQLMISAYLAEQRGEDAQAAMLRYQLDYGEGGDEWPLLQARVLLRGGLTGEAAEVLDGLNDASARDLLLLAQLRSGSGDAAQVIETARGRLREKVSDPGREAVLHAIIAEAGGQSLDYESQCRSLERLLALTRVKAEPSGLFALDGDSLWEAYIAYARDIANQRQLLVGRFEGWFELADTLSKKQPAAGRAMLALIALRSTRDGERQRAHALLGERLEALPGGMDLLFRLYPDSRRFADLASIPPVASQRMADQAIAEGDIVLASRLMGGMQSPPEGVDVTGWQLQRARILVLGGEPGAGVAALEALLDNLRGVDRKLVDRINQVLFDLQTIGEHDAAYRLFAKLYDAVLDFDLQREILFWMADSRHEQGRFIEAARLYLRSATLPGPAVMDPWAQTARYKAAQALASAGLADDARRGFEALLELTQDPGRRAVLRRELQQLWLHPHE